MSIMISRVTTSGEEDISKDTLSRLVHIWIFSCVGSIFTGLLLIKSGRHGMDILIGALTFVELSIFISSVRWVYVIRSHHG
jgi:hypothetical protein